MNVIVIACNSLHLGFLGTYGNGWIHTPNIDRLASEGVVFDHHFAENLTTIPTRRSWWTGRFGFPDPECGWTPLRSDETILPDLVWNRGIKTALISDVPLLRDAEQGFGRGFDETLWIRGQGYDPWIPAGDPRVGSPTPRIKDEPGLRLPPKNDPTRDTWKERWDQYLRNRQALSLNKEETGGPKRLVQAACDWLQRQGSNPDPFLLWLDIFSPHGPWDPPKEFRERYATLEPEEFLSDEEGDLVEEDAVARVEEVAALIDVPAGQVGDVISHEELLRLRKTYAGTVAFLDHCLGQLFDTLKTTGRTEDSLIVFTSDQGEPLGEHGIVRRFQPWLYDELVHTPLILRLPKAQFGGVRHRALVQTTDLAPTILSALNLPKPDGMHGEDLLPLIHGQKTKLRDYICMGMDVAQFAIRTQLWHLLLPVPAPPDPDDEEGEDDSPGTPELYRKPEDRWEQNNVIEHYPEIAEHLELLLRRFVEAVKNDNIDKLSPLRDIARFSS